MKKFQNVNSFSLGKKIKKVSDALSSGKDFCAWGGKGIPLVSEILGLNKDKTLIIVAHRLSTVLRCEKIYKMEKGKVNLVTNLNLLHDQAEKMHIIQE